MAAWNDVVPSRGEALELKRDAIYREAATAFNRRGFHGTSMDDIARELGVTKAALYRYVPNKHHLLRQCHDSAMDAAFASLEAGRAAGSDGLERLELTMRGYLEKIIDDFGHRVVLLEENALGAADADAIMRRRDRFEGGLRDLVQEGIDDGSVIPCDAKLAVFTILGAVNWVSKWYRPQGQWQGGQVAQALVRMAVRAIAARPAAALDTDIQALPPSDFERPQE